MATSDKYDRQLRLWGASGQRALSETCVVLFQASAAGTETLKNLVLPGIGAFCIVDDLLPSHADAWNHAVSSNFFVTNSTTKPTSRAEQTCALLQELNPDVVGTFLPASSDASQTSWKSQLQSLEDFDQHLWRPIQQAVLAAVAAHADSTVIRRYLVISSDLDPTSHNHLAVYCRNNLDVDYVRVVSYGLLGVVQLQLSPCPRPLIPRGGPQAKGSRRPDWRLQSTAQFPALQELAEKYTNNIAALSVRDRKHIPYPLLLWRILHYEYPRWKKQEQEGQSSSSPETTTNNSPPSIPKSWSDKQAFVRLLKETMLEGLSDESGSTNDDPSTGTNTRAAMQDAENVQEAVQYAYLAYAKPDFDISHIQTLLQQAEEGLQQKNTNAALAEFVLLLRALSRFVETQQTATSGGQPPLTGSVPDLTASTQAYVELQTVYRKQAQVEFGQFHECLQHEHAKQQHEVPLPSQETIDAFVQNIAKLSLIDYGPGRSLADEWHNLVGSSSGAPNTVSSTLIESMDDMVEEAGGASLDNDEEQIQKLQYQLDMMPLVWYLAYQACNLFFDQHQRYPGTSLESNDTSSYETDAPIVEQLLEQVAHHYGLAHYFAMSKSDQDQDTPMTDHSTIPKVKVCTDKIALEACRYGNAEIHNIAAIVGGVASQEAVKLITGHYAPLEHSTYVYNGISSMGGVYPF